MSLWGLGILNSENEHYSGEDHFIRSVPSIIGQQDALIVIDVGANIGSYSAKVKSVHSSACVYAFEPDHATFQQLNASATRYGYQVFNFALGSESRRSLFYNRPGGGSEHASLYREVITEIHEDTVVEVEVLVTTLDQFAQEHQLTHIHLLKIDTEGSELDVLRGAQRLLENKAIDLIQFEFNNMNVISHVFFRDFLSFLKGYKMYRMLPDGLVRIEQNPTFLSEIFAYQNIVAIRDK